MTRQPKVKPDLFIFEIAGMSDGLIEWNLILRSNGYSLANSTNNPTYLVGNLGIIGDRETIKLSNESYLNPDMFETFDLVDIMNGCNKKQLFVKMLEEGQCAFIDNVTRA